MVADGAYLLTGVEAAARGASLAVDMTCGVMRVVKFSHMHRYSPTLNT